MGKKTLLLFTVALLAMALTPAVASADLVNEYGMHFAGQSKCMECHEGYDQSVHGRFATVGLLPEAPEGWDVFRAGGAPQVAGTFPIDWTSGGEYSIAGETWVTLGDFEGGAATEYLFWQGSEDPKAMPWNLVEGLVAEPNGEWVLAAEEPEKGLYDVVYGGASGSCQRCHQLGPTWPTKDAADTSVVPNPAVKTAASPTTAKQWAREAGTTAADFVDDPAVSYPGMSIQCERCHGTGLLRNSPPLSSMHWNSGTQLSHRVEGASMATLGQSQVCGQCHGSFTNVPGTLGVYGYTPNLPLRTFVNIDSPPVPADRYNSYSYTKIPTEAEFLAEPLRYWMFPNGSNAKGNHYYYNEWAASAHSYRGAYYFVAPDPAPADAMTFQASGHGHYNGTTESNITSKCYQCHTGEGYLFSKDAEIAKDFVPAADNVGFMGQECVTCHTSHPAGVGDEGNLREPDAVGERSATGLARGNDSVCEDCHNWQFEVQGTSPSYKPQASLTSRGGPSHPQRETVQGRVMLDVSPAGNFMPGVKCEDCHMPKTNRNANRFSHGMKIMLPGDAETWMTAATAAGSSAYKGEDSCSSCHPGQSRDELQHAIEDWQDEAAAAADAAAAAITAAQTRAPEEYSLTDSTKPGYKLVGRATWNYKAWFNDLSGGVHNPEYVVDGLEKAEEMAKSVGGSFDQLFSSNSVVPGSTGFVTGKVVNGDGTPAAGAALELFEGATMVEDTVSAANGTFAFMVAPDADATYTVHWARSSEVSTHLMSADVKVAVVKIASKTTLAASAKTIVLGKPVKLTGKVSPFAAGEPVKLQYRKGTSGAWKTIDLLLGSTSGYGRTFKPGSRGTWYFKTLYAGTATVASSKSATVKLIVK